MTEEQMTEETVAGEAVTAASDVTVAEPVPGDAGDASLLALIDELGSLLERSELTELEVEVGGTAVTLRKPSALAVAQGQTAPAAPAAPAPSAGASEPAAADAAPARPSVKAPLTGIWYGSPSPGSGQYVVVGGEVTAGQVIGLIEAMKLFNEIKSDLSGRVVRVLVENGQLVKAKQPIIEVEPL